MDKRLEPGSGASHLGIRGRGAVEELRGERVSRRGWHSCVANTVEVMAEEGEGVVWGVRV